MAMEVGARLGFLRVPHLIGLVYSAEAGKRVINSLYITSCHVQEFCCIYLHEGLHVIIK